MPEIETSVVVSVVMIAFVFMAGTAYAVYENIQIRKEYNSTINKQSPYSPCPRCPNGFYAIRMNANKECERCKVN